MDGSVEGGLPLWLPSKLEHGIEWTDGPKNDDLVFVNLPKEENKALRREQMMISE